MKKCHKTWGTLGIDSLVVVAAVAAAAVVVVLKTL